MPYRSGFRAKLEAFSLDEPGAADPFGTRLARENCWSVDYAKRAVREYKRFVLLALGAGHPVSPSDTVDQVWHLHLTYTASYWGDFCEGLLGQPLHHQPSRGGSLEQARYREDYEKTLEAYRQTFGEEPPDDIWPSVERRFSADLHFVRLNPDGTIIVKKRTLKRALAITAAAAALLVFVLPRVLELPGPAFLGLYAASWLASLGLALGVRYWEPAFVPTEVPELQPYEAAYLAGNERAVARAAIASLVATEAVTLDERFWTLSVEKPLPVAAHAVEKSVYDQVRSNPSEPLVGAYAAAASAARDIGMRLRGLGLVVDRSSTVPLWLALMAPTLGMAKLTNGIARGEPVDFLPLPLIGIAIVAVRYCWPGPALSAVGRALLAGLKQEHAYLRWRGLPRSALGDMIPLAVGLFGLAVLPNFGLGVLSKALGGAHARALWVKAGILAGSCGGSCGGCGGGE